MIRNRKLLLVMLALAVGSGIFFLRSEITSPVIRGEEVPIVISLGEDLTKEQSADIIAYFDGWRNGRDTRYVSVSNQEERKYLQGLIDEKLIGSRAISSVYCEILDRSRGIEVITRNITSITPFMYANALSTAGIESARVIVAAPFAVSGTAALTGVIKAFEAASGDKLNATAKETAHQEIAETSKLGQKIGSNKAEKLVFEVKRQVIENNISDPEAIRKIIVQVSADLNINLSPDDIEQIVQLMQKLNGLNLSINRLNEQLKGLNQSLVKVKDTGHEANNLFTDIINSIKAVIQNIKNALA